MSNRLETAIKASAAEARLTKQKVLKELKQRMEGLILQIENDRLWISDLKELHNQVAEAVAKVAAADEKIGSSALCVKNGKGISGTPVQSSPNPA